jgi:serine phosphatase RsbU (regulator of sigma subunit)/putative methionine-R-sulfoxide reductase with GAF domain
MLLATTAQVSDPAWSSLLLGTVIVALLVAGLSVAWAARSRRQLRERGAEIASLRQAGSAIVASQLDVDALCRLIYHEAGKVIDNRTFQVGLFKDQRYHIKVWTINGEPQEPSTFDLGEKSGLVGWVRENRSPLLVRDFSREMDKLPARPLYVSDDPPQSAVFLPLVSGESVIGILAAQSAQRNRYTENDVRRLTILGNQAASGIANALLFESERQRAAQLELVSNIAQQVNAIQDLDEIFLAVVHLMQRQFGFSPVSIFSFRRGSGTIVLEATSGSDQIRGVAFTDAADGLIGTAIERRQTVISADVEADRRYRPSLGLPDLDSVAAGTRSEIVIPLVVDEEVLGVLDVHSPEPNAFSGQEQTVLEALAAQVAIAIHKARQLSRQREQAWLTVVQLQIAEAISQSTDLRELLDNIVRLIVSLIGTETCAVFVWDEEFERYRPGAIFPDDGEVSEAFHVLDLPIGQWNALDAVHVGRLPLVTDQSLPWPDRKMPAVLYPLIAKGAVTGVMVLQPPVDSTAVEEVVLGVTRQSAQAIDASLLAIAQQEEAWINTALLQVAEAVNSLIDLQDILATMVRLVPMLVGVQSCLVLVWDEERQAFHPGPSHGVSDMDRGVLASFEIESGDIGGVPSRPDTSASPDPTYYALRLPSWLASAMNSPVAHSFPLYARGQLVGALLVGRSLNGEPLSGRRLNILSGIAHQASIAVVNDQLYRESAEREKLAQELRLAHTIQSSMIPPGNPDLQGCNVASTWQAAREVSGDFYDFIALPDERTGIVIADVSDKGMPAAIFMAVSRTILRAVAHSRYRPGDTLQRVNDILRNDTESDLFVTIFYAVWDPRSGILSYANAGHNPPLLLRREREALWLRTAGIALGVVEHIHVGEQHIRLEEGDIVLLYTDGVTEATNEDYDEFGTERLRQTVQTARHHDAGGILAAVSAAMQDHIGDGSPYDDVTMIAIKRNAAR